MLKITFNLQTRAFQLFWDVVLKTNNEIFKSKSITIWEEQTIKNPLLPIVLQKPIFPHMSSRGFEVAELFTILVTYNMIDDQSYFLI